MSLLCEIIDQSETMLAFQGGGTRSQVSLLRREQYSSVIASSQLESLSAARAEEGTGEYLLTETCRLSRSWGGTWMSEVLRVRCMGTGDGACVGECVGEGTGEGVGEGVGEGGPVGLCGTTGGTTIEGTTIEGTSSRNS
jgi:hypothetical protein